MILNLIFYKYSLKSKFIKYDYKNNIFFYKPKYCNLNKLFNFILEVIIDDKSNLYQIKIFDYDLVKFIKDNKNYLQYETNLDNRKFIFRYNTNMKLKEIIVK
jgi:hypothetical protein